MRNGGREDEELREGEKELREGEEEMGKGVIREEEDEELGNGRVRGRGVEGQGKGGGEEVAIACLFILQTSKSRYLHV